MNVKELKEFLKDIDDDVEIVLSFEFAELNIWESDIVFNREDSKVIIKV